MNILIRFPALVLAVFLLPSTVCAQQNKEIPVLVDAFETLEEAIALHRADERMNRLITQTLNESGMFFGKYLNRYFKAALEAKSFDRENLEKVIQNYVSQASVLPIIHQQEILKSINAELASEKIPDLGAKNVEDEDDLVTHYYLHGMYKVAAGGIATSLSLLESSSPGTISSGEGALIGLTVFLPEIGKTVAYVVKKISGDMSLKFSEDEKREIAAAQAVKDRFMRSHYLRTCSWLLVTDPGDSDSMGMIKF